MGSSQSTASTLTIDKAIVEQHLNELTQLRSGVSALTAQNGALKQQVEENKIILSRVLEKHKNDLLLKDGIISENVLLRNVSDKNICAKQEDNERLQKRNEYLQSQVADLSKELNFISNQLKQSSDQCLLNKEKYEKKFNALNTQYCKVQTELQRYKTNESTIKLSELHLQLQKFISQTDATTKKLVKEVKTEEREANEDEFKRHVQEYDQYKQTLSKHNIFISNPDLETVKKKYKDLSIENDKKTKDVMKRVFVINQASKLTSQEFKTDIFRIINRVKTIIEKHNKDLGELKKISFSNDFKQEEKLYTSVLQLFHEQKTQFENLLKVICQKDSDDLKNNLNNLTKGSPSKVVDPEKLSNQSPHFSKSGGSSTSENINNVIIYNFPEGNLQGADNTAVDLINIKYFLGSFSVGDVNDITARRLPINGSEKIRPVIVTLPSYEAVNKILMSPHKISEFGLPNVKIVEYSGKVRDIDFDVWLKARPGDTMEMETKSPATIKQKKRKKKKNNSSEIHNNV